MKKGRAHTMTHDYKRHGTTTLFAALNTLDGSVLATCMERHRHQEWLKFLRMIDRQTPADKQLHLIVDNYATHKHPAVQRWATPHKRIHFHFTPTSSSWLNMVEIEIGVLRGQCLDRRIGDRDRLVSEIAAWQQQRNASGARIEWKFNTQKARQKLARAYPDTAKES